MKILEFTEEWMDSTRGYRGSLDDWDVIFETKDGEEFEIGAVKLSTESNLMVIEELQNVQVDEHVQAWTRKKRRKDGAED